METKNNYLLTELNFFFHWSFASYAYSTVLLSNVLVFDVIGKVLEVETTGVFRDIYDGPLLLI